MSDVITRPNGKVYRPRRVVCHRWDNAGLPDEQCGVVVIGTHDVTRARSLATEAIKRWIDPDYVATRPIVGWWRLGYLGGESAWISDERRGGAGVMFTAEEAPDV